MTELEALEIVRNMAYDFDSAGNTLHDLSPENGPAEQAIDLVDAMLFRLKGLGNKETAQKDAARLQFVWIMVATLDGDADTCVWAFASRDAAIALAKKLANEESDSGATEEQIANLHTEIDSLPDEGGVVFLTDNYAVKIEKVEVRR